jgi:uncharacterized protein
MEIYHITLPLFGFIVGLLSTMVGGNGAFFFPPALILFFQVSPRAAIATSLAAVLPMGLIGSAEHYRQKNINLPIAIICGTAGITGALTGAWVSNMMNTDTLIRAFGVYSILLGILIIKIPPTKQESSISPPTLFSDLNKKNIALIAFFGLIAGAVVGLFGTSGTAPVLAALFILQLPVKIVVGTSVLVVFINALSGFTGHFLVGEIELELIILLGGSAAAGAFLGPRLLGKLRPERKENGIRSIFAVVLIAMGLFLVVRQFN